jgi:predicted ATPase/class 3 adenylate cyclase
MRELPTGTVTFLFSDIEGSTRLLQEHPNSYADLLERHRELLRAAFRSGGYEVGTEGDSFFVAFPTAFGAVTAAVAGQRALDAEPWGDGAQVRVRMGLVTGDAEIRDGSYIGLAVHRAARLSAAAHGGQVLVSGETTALLDSDGHPGVTFLDLGEHRLKDIDEPERILQLVVDDLGQEFPPPRTLSVAATDLPEQLTTFLGREEEIASVVELVDSARLVTLTGPGGAGKTRLSIEVARRMIGRFRDGISFIPLAPIREVELVVPTIAARLGMTDRGGREPMRRLLEHLADRRLLLLLDNFEHVTAAAPEIGELLGGAPGLRVLVTSRAPLQIYGEHQYPVPPLPLPPATGRTTEPLALARYDAISLFVERAVAVAPDFRLSVENAAAVAEICQRLDGLPLAIELAAARMKVLSAQAIVDRLADRLSLRGAGNLPERQQTLRATVGWSYDLLDPPARELFDGMSLFVGGVDLLAAEVVLGGDASNDVVDRLTTLVDASLVGHSALEREPRFSMLETIRTFAAERLAASGRLNDLQLRHSAYFADLAAQARPEVLGDDAGRWLDLLEREHDNLRSVLTRAIEQADTALAMRLSADLWRFWQRRGYLAEGLGRVQTALELPGDVDPALRADALEAAGGLAYWQADGETTRAMYEQVLAIRRQQGDPGPIAEALYNLSFSYTWLSMSDSAARPDPDAALRLLDEARGLFEQTDDRAGLAKTMWGIATSEVWMNRVEDANVHVREADRLARELGDAFLIPWVLYLDALVALSLGELERARPALTDALARFTESGDVSGYTLVLDGFAALALRAGDRERAARLSGGVAELEARSGTGLNKVNRGVIGFDPDELRQDESLSDAWAEGSAMEAADLTAYAGQPTDSRP